MNDEPLTLAAKLGTSTQLSPLLRKSRKLGMNAEELEQLAIQRGCDYYDHGDSRPTIEVAETKFSNEELAIALLNPALRYSPQTLRLGAAMLSAPGNSPTLIAQLAREERGESIVRYIADAGQRFEPRNTFWKELLDLLPPSAPPKSSVVPHPTRFVAMTGFTRRGPEKIIEWIRPSRTKLHHG